MRTTVEHAPFLLLSIRAEDEAAEDEYCAVLRFAGLDEAGLRRIRLTEQELGSIDLADWSGLILGGGAYNVSDPDETKDSTQRRTERDLARLLHTVIERDFPFLGCCYGIGTVGMAVGATIDRTYAEPVGAVTVTRTDVGRSDPLLAELPDVFDAFGGHKEAVSTLPPGVVALASSAGCPVHAFRVGRNVYATQFHPELDSDGMCTRIDVYKNHGYFAPEAAETLKSDARQHDIRYPPVILRSFAERYRRAK